jgi:hypothetical protein
LLDFTGKLEVYLRDDYRNEKGYKDFDSHTTKVSTNLTCKLQDTKYVILRLYGSTDKDVVRVDFVCMVHKKQ